MTATQQRAATTTRTGHPAYSALIGLASLGVLLQGLWAGLFIGGKGETWVEVHGVGADVTIGLAVIATGYAFWRMRSRLDLVVGSLLLTVLLVLEAFLGGLIADEHIRSLAAVHVPLAMALMGLAVWLPLRSTRAA